MQTLFPSAYSTPSPAALAALIADKYALTDVQCQFLLRGVGDTYSIQAADGRFILRVYRHAIRTLPQVQEEADFLIALKDASVPVAYPVPDKSGEAIQVINAAEGERCAVLFTYAPGTVVNTLSEPQLRNLGRQMARMHNVSATMPQAGNRWAFDLETTLLQPLELLRTSFAYDQQTYTWLQQAAQHIQKKIATLNTATFSTGYCHYDMLPKNFHFEGDNITLFDFDFIGYGWLVSDLMTFWQHLALDVHFGKMTQEVADKAYAVLLDGYRKHRTISEEELAAVPYLLLGFWLFYSGFHTTHDQFYTFIQPAHLTWRFGFVRKLMERYCEKEYLP